MQVERKFNRIEVEIPVTVMSVLETTDASIVDLTEGGAQVTGCSIPEGTRFQIEYLGQTLFAQVRWSEIDRMGIKFLFPLNDGPLYERLMLARASSLDGEGMPGISLAMAPIHNGGITRGARTFSRVATAGFGRRS